MPFLVVIAVVGAALFWVPYQLTGMIVNRLRLIPDVRSTWKLLIGIVLYAVWLIVLVIVAGATLGWVAALLTAVGVPVVAMIGLQVRERWQASWSDARRFLLLRSRRSLIARLRSEQRDLAGRLEGLR
jgi:hypothetical protein